jgi:hypothetical protein
MDAANTFFSKTVLFLATALLMVAPGFAQPSFNLNSSNTNTITVSPPANTGASVYVAGTNDSSTPITFTESAVAYTVESGYNTVDPPLAECFRFGCLDHAGVPVLLDRQLGGTIAARPAHGQRDAHCHQPIGRQQHRHDHDYLLC